MTGNAGIEQPEPSNESSPFKESVSLSPDFECYKTVLILVFKNKLCIILEQRDVNTSIKSVTTTNESIINNNALNFR